MVTTKTRSIKTDKDLMANFEAFAVSKGESFNSMLVKYMVRVTPKKK